MSCPHCQQPTLDLPCDCCYGFGRCWRGEINITCPICHGSGRDTPCTNTTCPGIKWYPLSRDDSATLRMVIASVEREEKR